MAVLGALLEQGRQQRAADPGAGPGLLDLLGEHRAKGVLVRGDDERDGVGQGAVEVEEHDPVAEALVGCG